MILLSLLIIWFYISKRSRVCGNGMKCYILSTTKPVIANMVWCVALNFAKIKCDFKVFPWRAALRKLVDRDTHRDVLFTLDFRTDRCCVMKSASFHQRWIFHIDSGLLLLKIFFRWMLLYFFFFFFFWRRLSTLIIYKAFACYRLTGVPWYAASEWLFWIQWCV